MAISNPVLFGLKVASNFADIESKSTALNNLGLDIRDLETIQGISPTVSTTELQQVSGLDVNLTKYIAPDIRKTILVFRRLNPMDLNPSLKNS